MFDAAVPTDTASSTDWNPSRFADISPLAGNLHALASESPALVGAPPTAEQQRCEILSDEITTLAGHLNAANYRFLKLLDEFDRHDGWAGDGIRSLAHWLNIARHGTAAHMERLVRAYRRCRKQVESAPGESAPGELTRRREERFYCYAEDDETMVFGGQVAVEQGRLLVKALDAMVAEIDGEASAQGDAAAEGDASTAQTANALEMAGNVSAETNGPVTGPETDENVSAETSGGEPVTETEGPAPRRTGRATALVHIAEHYLATGGSGARPLTSSEASQVFVHVNANDAGP